MIRAFVRPLVVLLPTVLACGPTPPPAAAAVPTVALSAPPPQARAPQEGHRCATVVAAPPVPVERDAPRFLDPDLTIVHTPEPAPPRQVLRVVEAANGWNAQVLAETFASCRPFVRAADVGERTLRLRFDDQGKPEGVAGIDDVALRTTRFGRCLVERACALPPRTGSSPRVELAVSALTEPPSFLGQVEVHQSSWNPAKASPRDEAARLEQLRLAYATAARRCVEEHPSDYPYVFSLELAIDPRTEPSPGIAMSLGKLGSAVVGCIMDATRGLAKKSGLVGTLELGVSVQTEPR